MPSRRFVIRTVLTAGVVAALAVDLGAPDVASAVSPCERGGSAIVLESPQAVVVRWRVREHRTDYWACLRNTRRAVFLIAGGYEDPDGAEQRLVEESKFALEGRFVAVVSAGCGEKCADYAVDVYDLRSGRRVRRIQPGLPAKLLLSPRGALVLVQDFGERRVIRVMDSRGSRLVTQGPRRELPVAFMHVDGNVLRWRQAGIAHSFAMR